MEYSPRGRKSRDTTERLDLHLQDCCGSVYPSRSAHGTGIVVEVMGSKNKGSCAARPWELANCQAGQ